MTTLTITVCTNKIIIDDLLSYLSNYTSKKVQVVIVWQRENHQNDVTLIQENLVLVTSDTKGLSVARNISIKYSTGKFIWFQDDDISIIDEEYLTLLNYLTNTNVDVCFVNIKSDHRMFYKKNNIYDNLKLKKIVSACSISILVNKNRLDEKKIEYDECIGLGTEMPCCEENLFLYNLLINESLNFKNIDITPCFHTSSHDNRIKESLKHLNARIYLLSKFKLHHRIIMIPYWSYKFSNKADYNNKSFIKIFKHFVKVRKFTN